MKLQYNDVNAVLEETSKVVKRRLKATSTGTVQNDLNNPQNVRIRKIEAVIADSPVLNAITANGTVNANCQPDGSAEILGTCEQFAGVTLLNFFGMVYSNDHNGNISITDSKTGTAYTINHKYDDNPATADPTWANAVYNGLTVVTSSNGVHNTKDK